MGPPRPKEGKCCSQLFTLWWSWDSNSRLQSPAFSAGDVTKTAFFCFSEAPLALAHLDTCQVLRKYL